MKKLIALMLVLVMAVSFAACSQPAAEEPATTETTTPDDGTTEEAPAAGELKWDAANVQASVEAAVAATDGKIAIITNTVSQNEEEYRSAAAMVEKYGDRVIHDTMPDNFMAEQEQFISVINKYGTDPDVKCIIINQACPGSNPGIDKVAEVRDLKDLLVIYCTPQENPTDITTRADITISVDEVGKGTFMAEKANEMGCKTFVHYSFPRHMAQVTLAGCRDKIKAKCKELGIEFVDATAPDPTGDTGLSGSQQFILEDVPKMVEKYGKETAFFTTNCGMQEPLQAAVLDQPNAYYPQPCCPSPYHAFPASLGLEIKAGGDDAEALKAIAAVLKEHNALGRYSTWPSPVNMSIVDVSVEYAKKWIAGEITSKNDGAAIAAMFEEKAPGAIVSNYTNADGQTFDNYYTVLLGAVDFNDYVE